MSSRKHTTPQLLESILPKPLRDLLLLLQGSFPTHKDAGVYLVEEAMRRTTSNQRVATTLLGITRQSLNRRLKSMGNQ